MKSNKFLASLCATALLMGAWSCDSEVDYTPADAVDSEQLSNQVYFSDSESTTISLETDAEYIYLPVYRVEGQGALTVALDVAVVNPDGESVVPDVFNPATEVTFADGETVAQIPVAVTFDAVEGDVNYAITINIEENNATIYGASVFEGTILYAPWSEYELMDGYCVVTWNNVLGGFGANGYEQYVFYAESLINPNLSRYYVPTIWSDADMSLTVTVDKTRTFDINGQECYWCYCDLVTFGYYDIVYEDAYSYLVSLFGNYTYEQLTTYIEYYFDHSYFNPATGELYVYIVPYVDGDPGGGWYSAGYTVVQLPGYIQDEVNIAYVGNMVDPTGYETSIFTFSRSGNTAALAYEFIQGDLDEDAIDAAITALGENTDATLYTDESFNVEIELETGMYTIIAVGYDSGNNPLCSTYYKYDSQTVQQTSPWKDLGYALYTDVYLKDLVGECGATMEVLIQESTEKAGYYRLVNPYKEWVAANPGVATYAKGNYYLYINAAKPKRVVIEQSELGVQIDGEMISAWSLAGYTLANGGSALQVTAQGAYGTLSNNVITFSASKLLGQVGADGDWSYCNTSGDFMIDFSDVEAAPRYKADQGTVVKGRLDNFNFVRQPVSF